jgi:glycosyltransferase involved in cell wall biosynthesis
LPSYLEGLPKSLVDAAAAGRASVTTDVPGCRDAIIDGVTGLLCRVGDASDLAEKIAVLLESDERRLEMGTRARQFAEREFDIRQVVARHLACYGDLARASERGANV